MMKHIAKKEAISVTGGKSCTSQLVKQAGQCVEVTTCYDKHGKPTSQTRGTVPTVYCNYV